MSKLKIVGTILFVIVQAELLLLVQSGINKRQLSFAAIAVCFGFAAIVCLMQKKVSIVFFALFFTLVADFFFVLMQNRLTGNQYFAMLSFLVVQTLYCVEILKGMKRSELAANLILRAILVALIELVVVLLVGFEPFLMICGVYFVNLVFNMIFSFASTDKGKLFAIGLLLFVLCDFTLLLQNTGNYLADAAKITEFFSSFPLDLVWLFYIPSQTLIALCTIEQAKSPAPIVQNAQEDAEQIEQN